MTDRPTSFDAVAEEYERGRPGWPEEMLDLLPLPSAATVVDLGAGTGKLTRTLARRYARVIAVEPLPAMRGILERELPGVESHEGSAEAIPLRDASVDGVFCGQSAHWFAADEAVAEIARVLRPGGVLVSAWNQPDSDRPSPVPEAFARRLAKLRPALPGDTPWERAVERGPFGRLQRETVGHDQWNDREMVLRGVMSASWIASRPDRDAVVAELGALLPEGDYVVPLSTYVTWAVRR